MIPCNADELCSGNVQNGAVCLLPELCKSGILPSAQARRKWFIVYVREDVGAIIRRVHVVMAYCTQMKEKCLYWRANDNKLQLLLLLLGLSRSPDWPCSRQTTTGILKSPVLLPLWNQQDRNDKYNERNWHSLCFCSWIVSHVSRSWMKVEIPRCFVTNMPWSLTARKHHAFRRCDWKLCCVSYGSLWNKYGHK